MQVEEKIVLYISIKYYFKFCKYNYMVKISKDVSCCAYTVIKGLKSGIIFN